MSAYHFIIILPFIGAFLLPFIYRSLPRVHAGWCVLPIPVVLFVYLLGSIADLNEAGSRNANWSWMPSYGIDFNVYIDGLGLLFALLITGIGSLVVFYSIFYMDKRREKLASFYVYLLLFMGAMLGLVLSDNMMVLYGFWELTSLSSFLLIAFWHERGKSRYGALKSLVITVAGGLAMFAGFLLIYVMTGTFSIREVVSQLPAIKSEGLFIAAMLLVLLGAFTKSAQYPFHIWLPDAMEAPTPVSAYLHSATMVKAGLYLVARFSPVFSGHMLWFWLVSGIGLATLIYGSYRAMKQIDLKAILAYSTISQLGLIMCLLGLGSAAELATSDIAIATLMNATLAAVFHLINHAVFKGALFMTAGIIDHSTGTRDIRRLGGLMAIMPITFTIALIGTFSMAGLPPFSGFLSKEMFFTAVVKITTLEVKHWEELLYIFPVVAWIASVFTFFYSIRLLLRAFGGKGNIEKLERKPHEASLGLLIPPVILASLAVLFGLFPNVLSYTILEPVLHAVHPALIPANKQIQVAISFWHGPTVEVFMTIGVIGLGLTLYLLSPRLALFVKPLGSRWSLNSLYDRGVAGAHRLAGLATRRYMTGSIQHYMLYILITMLLLIGVTFALVSAFHIDTTGYADATVFEIVIIAALIAAALAVPFARTRLTAILLTGLTGYLVVLFFVIFRAPDLALTQIIVETVSVALFLLCFYHLPKLKREKFRPRFKLLRLLVALAVGVTVTIIALSASSTKLFDSISQYYVQNSVKLAGGSNIVNVILVDFRGFDTMLEIVVLAIASFGIYSLIKMGEQEKTSDNAGMPAEASSPTYYLGSNDVMLQTIGKLAVVIMLCFSLYLLYSGHNQPGGGFIGALVASSAFILLAMAFGMKSFERFVPVDFRKITAFGLMIAFLTGAGSFLFKVPFLTHSFGHIELPLIGSLELATAMIFDLGVYLTVLGVTMTIIFTIGRDRT